jgi:hypothetical protein
MNDMASWSKPKNIGHPLNTDQDEHGLIVSADGHTAYFASAVTKVPVTLDIFGFELPKEARPDDILLVKGEVRNEKGELVRMPPWRSNTWTREGGSDPCGQRERPLCHGGEVESRQRCDHDREEEGPRLRQRAAFPQEDTVRAGVAKVDMKVQKIEVGKSYRVNDIKYPTNSADITKSSEYILDELIGFLKENPTVKIRIEGHTDSRGGAAENKLLSNDPRDHGEQLSTVARSGGQPLDPPRVRTGKAVGHERYGRRPCEEPAHRVRHRLTLIVIWPRGVLRHRIVTCPCNVPGE